MKLIGTMGDFELFEREPNGPWRNLKLVRNGEGHPKQNWILGWDGERLADGKDRKLLAEHNPQIEQWVLSNLRSMQ